MSGKIKREKQNQEKKKENLNKRKELYRKFDATHKNFDLRFPRIKLGGRTCLFQTYTIYLLKKHHFEAIYKVFKVWGKKKDELNKKYWILLLIFP